MKNDLFHIGPLTVHGYGTMIAIGVLAAYFVAERRAKKQGLDYERLFDLAIWALVGGMLGAKLLYYIVEFRSILANPKLLLDVMHGFVVYGGIIGGILAGYLFCRIKHFDFLRYFDLVMPSIALAQGFGRIGCLLAGCCYGRETDSWFHIVFHDSEFAPNEVWLIPTQILSSLFNFAHFFLLIFLAKRVKARGQVAGLYLVCYSIGRFFLEFLRNDPRGNVRLLSTSQFISIFILAAGISVITVCGLLEQRRKKSGERADGEDTDRRG